MKNVSTDTKKNITKETENQGLSYMNCFSDYFNVNKVNKNLWRNTQTGNARLAGCSYSGSGQSMSEAAHALEA